MRKCVGGVMTAALWASIVQADTTENSIRPLARPMVDNVQLASADVTVSVRPVLRPKVEVQRVSADGNARFQAWLGAFRKRAQEQGISVNTLDRALAGVTYDSDIIKRDRNQAEFSKPIWEYLDGAVSKTRISNGRVGLDKHRETLTRIEAQYGVEKEVVTAIWGLETSFGTYRGSKQTIRSLATLAFDARRASFFEGQLIAALQILQAGDVDPENMVGSWAGAMGHTQFIPTSYLAYAVDFTGDGRRDIWSEDPTDSLASTAAYLARAGWVRGQPWGGEAGTVSGTPVAVLQPQKPGPRIAVFRNFQVIKRYNNSDSYAIGVGHLSDRIAGGAPFQASFGPDETGLTLEDRKELQRRLTSAGYDTQGADGVIGNNSKSAISAYQRANGLSVTGEPSVALLRQLGG